MSASTPFLEKIAESRARSAHNAGVRRRTGKIARLPVELRTWINTSLLDGAPYQDICAELERRGHPGITDGCLTSWFQGGYQDWLRAAEHLEQCRVFSENAHEMARDLKNDAHKIADLNETLVAAQLTQCLYEFDPNQRLHSIDEFLRVARAVNQQARERSIRHRALLAVRKYSDQAKTKTVSEAIDNNLAPIDAIVAQPSPAPTEAATPTNPETTLATLPDSPILGRKAQ